MHGANQTFVVETDPVGATVKFSNGATCVTPCKLELPRRYDFPTDLTLEGYRPVYVLVRSNTGGATFGNLLTGGIVGAVVDSSNGANKHLSTNPLKVRMTPVGQTTAEVLLEKKERKSARSKNTTIRCGSTWPSRLGLKPLAYPRLSPLRPLPATKLDRSNEAPAAKTLWGPRRFRGLLVPRWSNHSSRAALSRCVSSLD